MANVSQAWAASATSLAWAASTGPDGLANATLSNASNALDLTGLGNITDLLLMVQAQTASGTLGTNPYVQLLVRPSMDGSNYPPVNVNTLSAFPGQIITTAAATEYGRPLSLVSLLGALPKKIELALYNNTGLALGGTAGGNTVNQVWYLPIYDTVI